MAEVLFVLTTIFVAYVVYAVVGDQISDIKTMNSKASTKSEPEMTAAVRPVQQPIEKPAPEPKPAVHEPETSAASSTARTAAAKGGLKDPATGEVVNIPNNYRFAKRWIKEALVSEGLLDKVYKTNELDDKTNAKIKRALTKLANMDQYRA